MEELKENPRFLTNDIPYLSDIEKTGEEKAPVYYSHRGSKAALFYRDLRVEIIDRMSV